MVKWLCSWIVLLGLMVLVMGCCCCERKRTKTVLQHVLVSTFLLGNKTNYGIRVQTKLAGVAKDYCYKLLHY